MDNQQYSPTLLAQATERPAKKSHSATTSQTVQQASAKGETGNPPPTGFVWAVMVFFVVLAIVALYVLARIVRKLLAPRGKKDAAGFVQAEYGIPHCKFTDTSEGFNVSYRRMSSSKGLGVLGQVASLSFIPSTNIEVTREAVVVDGQKYRRADFVRFEEGEFKGSAKGWRQEYMVIGYLVGNKHLVINGLWKNNEGMDFLAAINGRLRAAPQAGDAYNPPPEVLRDAARSSDF